MCQEGKEDRDRNVPPPCFPLFPLTVFAVELTLGEPRGSDDSMA